MPVEVLSRHFPGGREERHEKLPCGCHVSRQKSETRVHLGSTGVGLHVLLVQIFFVKKLRRKKIVHIVHKYCWKKKQDMKFGLSVQPRIELKNLQ
jgi:hypothetical protein